MGSMAPLKTKKDDYKKETENGHNDASRAQLRDAILRVPEARLRRVLVDLIDTVPAVYHALARELVTVSPTTRVVVPRWERCANCGETYDVNDSEEECTFHPGDLEADEEKFPDWDEDCHGPMDTENNREEYPQNFSCSLLSDSKLIMACHSSSSYAPSPTFDPSPTFPTSSASLSASKSSFADYLDGSRDTCTFAIAMLSERELRTLLIKLAAKPTLERVIAHELRHAQFGKLPLRSLPPDAVCANCHTAATASTAVHCTFHPGHLEERVFEFLSRMPDGRPLTIRRTLAMWTCCAEDYQTEGCAEVGQHLWRISRREDY
ncbi:hypothetical protein MSAN_00413000 [Mycena sanguinolenta]|uniref:Uncharacterized protein n=1 Tax=Mycena sanguinolenta TaxID=230812 RepID=A0A8H6ZAD3_9AGAR|nr:hypothetical protein MSAN_00413000 [Mycena sanguinolenta]